MRIILDVMSGANCGSFLERDVVTSNDHSTSLKDITFKYYIQIYEGDKITNYSDN